MVPYRGAHKRFARRQEALLEDAWRRHQTRIFFLNATLRPWPPALSGRRQTARWNSSRARSAPPLVDEAFEVSLPRMAMRPVLKRILEYAIRRVPRVAPAWWLPGRVACGFELDSVCEHYNKRNAGLVSGVWWNRTVRHAAARSGTVRQSHLMDQTMDIV